MATDIKEQLIASIKELHLTPTEEKTILRDIENSFNEMLTRLIFSKIVAKHPSILTNENNQAFKRFCLEEVGLIEENIEEISNNNLSPNKGR